jgi:hypothetical protein
VANAGSKFNVKKGCMSVQQKEALLGSHHANKSIQETINRFSMGFDPKMIVPIGTVQSNPNTFVYDTRSIHRDEFKVLQGAMALRMIGAPQYLVEEAFALAMGSDDANPEHLHLYRSMLNLPELTDGSPL